MKMEVDSKARRGYNVSSCIERIRIGRFGCSAFPTRHKPVNFSSQSASGNMETGEAVNFKYTTFENPLQAVRSKTACQNAFEVVEISGKRSPNPSSKVVDQFEVFAEKLFASAILHLSYEIPSKVRGRYLARNDSLFASE
jgi:hypothetical protein